MSNLMKNMTRRERSKAAGGKLHMGGFVDIHTPAYKKRAVISIDFGSTHCGVAYSLVTLKKDIPDDVTDIDLRDYLVEPDPFAKNYRGVHSKQPTCALFDAETKKLRAFGFSAREEYLNSVANEDEEELSKIIYFEGSDIKMRFWEASFNFNAPVYSVDDRTKLPLKTVVSEILRYLKTEALELTSKGMVDETLTADECLWVLTVPSIWRESDKLFMREAAFHAGLISQEESSDLILALEPECSVIAASLGLKGFNTNDKILVFDCGGGTVDICAIEILSSKFEPSITFDNLEFGEKSPSNTNSATTADISATNLGVDPGVMRMRHLLQPTGGDWGSTYIDKNFKSFLAVLFNDPELKRLREIDVSSVIEVLDDFESLKASITYKEYKQKTGTRILNVSNIIQGFKQLALEEGEPFLPLESYVERFNQTNHARENGVGELKTLHGNNLILPMSIIHSFFSNVITKIVTEMKNIMDTPQLEGLNYVLLVGGFADSKVLKKEMNRKIKSSNGVRLLIPKRPDAVVQIGAVHFGFDPNIISTRRAKQTIGLKTTMLLKGLNWTQEEQESSRFSKRVFFDKKSNQKLVKNIFQPFITKGDEVKSTHVVTKTLFSPHGLIATGAHKKKQTKVAIYATDTNDIPRFVDEPGCVMLAEVLLPTELKGKIKVMMSFASTEIIVRVSEEKHPENVRKVGFTYNNAGMDEAGVDSNDTLIHVPVRKLGTWADMVGLDSYPETSEML